MTGWSGTLVLLTSGFDVLLDGEGWFGLGHSGLEELDHDRRVHENCTNLVVLFDGEGNRTGVVQLLTVREDSGLDLAKTLGPVLNVPLSI